ncbi:MAG: glutamate--tRNA ligase [Bacteroidia bacterium]|jgi:glutamyl-tRNA synthetase|nr:glutamate--tRNA ligase [Bacteroidia bacterium]
MIRTRFAPSPTGPLHMGGVRTALYAYLFAKQHNGQFVLRIEDTDQNRYVPGAEEYILEALTWCGIIPDEGVGFGGKHEPYRQSERKHKGFYMDYAKRLLNSGNAYYAFDSADDLDIARKNAEAAGVHGWQYDASTRMNLRNSLSLAEQETKHLLDQGTSYVIRLKVQPGQTLTFTDMVRGEVSFDSALVDDKVLIKADGMPTYHLAHIVDDIMMEITHAIRGEEWLPSAPAHILIYQSLGIPMPQYAHLPLLLKPEGNGKLSKRDGDRLGFPVFPLQWKDPITGEISSGYREKGYYADSFINMLALLGWNPGTEQEVFSLDELVKIFSFDRVHKSGARFDPDKAKWFNEQRLRHTDDAILGEHFYHELKNILGADHPLATLSYATGAVKLLKERVQFENELYETGKYLFEAPTSYDDKVISKRWNDAAKVFLQNLPDVLSSVPEFTAELTKAAFEKLAIDQGIKPGEVLQLFRVIMSGQGSGVDLFGMVALFGKDEVFERINRFQSAY